jgi:hypothetical protein
MRTHMITPGLAVTETMYQAAAAGITHHVSLGAPLTWERFTAGGDWTLVPDDAGRLYKAEYVVTNTPAQTVKVNAWFGPDRRGGERPMPHNHPWAFDAHILLGGYEEDRYHLANGTVRDNLGVVHREGGTNAISREVYHEVTGLRPDYDGHVLTLMVCGRGQRGTWGYLDIDTAEHTLAAPDPAFTARLAALNPHRQR